MRGEKGRKRTEEVQNGKKVRGKVGKRAANEKKEQGSRDKREEEWSERM